MEDNNNEENNEIIDNQISINGKINKKNNKLYTRENSILFKDNSLQRLDMSFMKHIEAKEYKKSDLLAYWVKDYANYHDEESTFAPSSLRYFTHGDIVKVNLGFNIGHELGGLHYCLVINKYDNHSSGNLNVVPLSSTKPGKIYNKKFCVNLGDELYSSLHKVLKKELEEASEQLEKLTKTDKDDNFSLEFQKISDRIKVLIKTKDELLKMKHGSMALVNQITTISKQRIFKEPLLAKVKISNKSLDLIDKKIKELYTK